ncbi:MAG: hypothetical protein Q9202_002368 [Teloschistes flavicans]
MPFPYQTAGAPVRVRKPLRERDKDKDRERERGRDKDTRSVTSSSSKRHTETSRSSNRSPLPSSSRPASLYSHSNISLDQLPALPRSETASPSSTTSLPLRTSTSPSTSSIPLSSSSHPYTPAALQPYLETDDDDDDDDEWDNAATPQASSSNQVKRYFDPELIKSPSRTVSILSNISPPTSAPKASSKPVTTTSPPTSAPKAASKPVTTTSPPTSAPKAASKPVTTTSPTSSAPTVPATKTLSPQQRPALSPTLSRITTRSSDPTPSLQHPRPHHVPVGSSAFSPTAPFFGSPPPEQYYPPFPPAPPYYPMAQAPGHPMDHPSVPPQNFYQPQYGSSPPMHTAFHQLRSTPARESSISSSRISVPGEPLPPPGHMSIFSAELAPRPEPFAQVAPREEDDAVLQRIQNAIPDLHLLLTRYQQTSNQLGQHEVALRKTKAEKAEVLKRKDTHIEQLTRDVLEKSRRSQEESSKHEDEKNKMRLELGNHIEQKKELEDHFHTEKTSREHSEKMVQALRVEHALLASKFEEEKAALLGEHEDQKIKFHQEHEGKVKEFQAREKEYVDRLERQMRDAEASLGARIVELTQQHGSEKESQERAWARQRAEWEESRRNQQREASDARDAHLRSLSEQRERHHLEREAWARERDSLKKDLDNERASAGRGSEELIALHRKEKDEMQRSWDSTEARLNQELIDAEARMRIEIDWLKAGWEADRVHYSKTTTELRAAADRLSTENSKLQRVAEAFEQVTDLRGREDAY